MEGIDRPIWPLLVFGVVIMAISGFVESMISEKYKVNFSGEVFGYVLIVGWISLLIGLWIA